MAELRRFELRSEGPRSPGSGYTDDKEYVFNVQTCPLPLCEHSMTCQLLMAQLQQMKSVGLSRLSTLKAVCFNI